MNIEADFNYRKPLKENEAKPAYGLEEPNEDNNNDEERVLNNNEEPGVDNNEEL